jgi:hypothetical protein
MRAHVPSKELLDGSGVQIASDGGGKKAPPIAGDSWLETRSMSTILLIILIIILIGAIPSWPYSRGWGYGPSGIVGVLVIILIIALLMGYRF